MSNIENEIIDERKLRELAFEIRNNIHELKHCFVIEFMGLPKSGKTTVIRLLSHYLRRNSINCYIVFERASVCPIKGKQSLSFSIWNACSSLLKVLETSNEPQKTVIIFDRGIFDALVWMKTFSQINGIKTEEFETFIKFFTNQRWINHIDLLIHLKTTVEQSLLRENDDVLIDKPGSIMNFEVLKDYEENATLLKRQYSAIAKNYKEYDTTTTETKANARRITIDVLKTIKELSDEEIAVFPSERINVLGNLKKYQILIGAEAISFLLTIGSEKYFKRRSIAETSSDIVQIVPITMIENSEEIAVFQKFEKHSNQRFHLKNTLWVGGHFREEDNWDDDIVRSTKNCIKRELREELNYEIDIDSQILQFIGILYDPIAERSRRHVGVLYTVNGIDSTLRNRIDGKNISEKSGQSHYIEIVKKEDLLKDNTRKFENWSLSIASSYLKLTITKDMENQLELF